MALTPTERKILANKAARRSLVSCDDLDRLSNRKTRAAALKDRGLIMDRLEMMYRPVIRLVNDRHNFRPSEETRLRRIIWLCNQVGERVMQRVEMTVIFRASRTDPHTGRKVYASWYGLRGFPMHVPAWWPPRHTKRRKRQG